MSEGKIILTCGCVYEDDIDNLDTLLRVWVDEVCTRDPDNLFVTAEISGLYCDKCWKQMQEPSHDR